ncbi:putative 2-aminoethylphosphonate ABC transporter permease subunit [bacterium]|nr:putative 2-aminoethylphosphonate ABC transporter permease subunit [bacterium]
MTTFNNRISKLSPGNLFQKILIVIFLLFLVISIILPLCSLFVEAFHDKSGSFTGIDNFYYYFSNPALSQSVNNTLFISFMTTIISVLLAFFYAYSLTRVKIKWKTFFKYVALLPLFAPTMLQGISLVYLFGNKGIFTSLGIDINLYGAVGIIISEILYTFPQAYLILLVAFEITDYRLYEAAETLGAGRIKQFIRITVPSVKYGLLSAIFVCFTLSFTDFGAPKVVGGDYNVLATDIYKQIVGQQNFSMGAVVGIILLLPALVSFTVDRITTRKQSSFLSSKSIPFQFKKKPADNLFFFYCFVISVIILIFFLVAIFASLVKIWPYNLKLTFSHYIFKTVSSSGIKPYINSIIVSFVSSVVGTVLIFSSAYLIEKLKSMKIIRQLSYFISIIPLALPGLIIGISYIMFFNRLNFNFFGFTIPNIFNFIYGTIIILVLANIIHFYSVPFITANTALKKIEREFENVSYSMSIPVYKTFLKVTVPLSITAIMENLMYIFVNSMTTVSAVIFLYTSQLKLASIAVIHMEEGGSIASAAAMANLIVLTNVAVRIIYEIILKKIRRKTDAWQKR